MSRTLLNTVATETADEIMAWLADGLDEIGNDTIDDSTLDVVLSDRVVRLSARVMIRREPSHTIETAGGHQ